MPILIRCLLIRDHLLLPKCPQVQQPEVVCYLTTAVAMVFFARVGQGRRRVFITIERWLNLFLQDSKQVFRYWFYWFIYLLHNYYQEHQFKLCKERSRLFCRSGSPTIWIAYLRNYVINSSSSNTIKSFLDNYLLWFKVFCTDQVYSLKLYPYAIIIITNQAKLNVSTI